MTQRRHPPVAVFPMTMGLSGLAMVWTKLATQGSGLAQGQSWLSWAWWLSPLLAVLAAVVFLICLALYLRKACLAPELVRQEWAHPVQMAFFAAIPVTLILLGTLSMSLLAPLALPLWGLGTAGLLLVFLLVLNAWVHRPGLRLEQASPAWFIPAVATVLVPVAGVGLGHALISWWFFGVGMVFWLLLFTLVMARLMFAVPAMPEAQSPSLAIFLASPTVGFLGWMSLTAQVPDGRGLDPVALMLLGLAFFISLFLLTQLPRYARLRFSWSWWSFSFPTSALTTVCLTTQAFYPDTGLAGLAQLMVVLVSLLIPGLLLRTLWAVLRRESLD